MFMSKKIYFLKKRELKLKQKRFLRVLMKKLFVLVRHFRKVLSKIHELFNKLQIIKLKDGM
jgi:hypothetical protein